MKRETEIAAEEALLFLAYCADALLMRPTLRRWDMSYEHWLSRNGLLRRFQYLEARKFLERQPRGSDWVWKLTAAGRRAVHDGRDPQALWDRPWDGWWRQIIFDLPVAEQRARSSLVRWLHTNGFGYLQDSVWISPDRIETISAALKHHREDAAAFTILECRCARGFTDAALVKGAWPFEKINAAYRAYESFAREQLRSPASSRRHPRAVFSLLRAERALWREAFTRDPLLPSALWPPNYSGARAWRLRQRLLAILTAEALRS